MSVRKKRRFLSLLLGISLFLQFGLPVCAEPVELESKSAVLMEASTGTIIYEYNKDEQLSPASITKIMTLLLIFEALEEQKISLTDVVTVSTYASSMGGSQVFLAEGEQQTVETMIKCITVASANDASVAMAEQISGSEEAFVSDMNAKAAELGMVNTHFVDCCGLTDSDQHYTSAYDVALMSRALIIEYPAIYEYTQIWMEDITHVTRNSTSTFTLSSTNKLLKQYSYATGLKTGSTQKAKFCLSATANKNNMDMIAVVMAHPNPKERFREAIKLLEYGYSISQIYTDMNDTLPERVSIKSAIQEDLEVSYREPFSYLDIAGSDLSQITKELVYPEEITAPVHEGDVVGKAVYRLNGEQIGEVELISNEEVEKAGYGDFFLLLLKKFFI